jgi:hypothetical protein
MYQPANGAVNISRFADERGLCRTDPDIVRTAAGLTSARGLSGDKTLA